MAATNHKWVKGANQEQEEYVCKNCGVKKWNIHVGSKNGRAALYILHNGERTSYRPDCNWLNKAKNPERSVATKDAQ